MRIASLIAAGALLAAAASPSIAAVSRAERGEAQLAKALAGRVAGPPVNCLQLHQIQSSEVISGTAILYRVGSRIYVNRPDTGAESLTGNEVLVTDTHSSQLCNIDSVKLLDRSSPHFYRGFVGLGQFVPYEKPRLRD